MCAHKDFKTFCKEFLSSLESGAHPENFANFVELSTADLRLYFKGVFRNSRKLDNFQRLCKKLIKSSYFSWNSETMSQSVDFFRGRGPIRGRERK